MATYAAEAPRISCLLALVKSESTVEKTRVATKRMPILLVLDTTSSGPLLHLYKA